MTPMKHLIKQIAGGRTSFEPEEDSLDGLRKFQQVAASLFEAENLGYIQDVTSHQESDSGQDFYDCVVVGSATELGQQFSG
ncbi:MAG: hypothetical protein DDT34_02209 [Firmicutes bacterium]|nr:hypothetical protein [Bacillota bacterium]